MDAIGTGLLTDEDTVARFWARVVKDAGEQNCWDWTGAYLNPDYFNRQAVFRPGERAKVDARAFAWALEHGTGRGGRVPALIATCGNDCCVRPAHQKRGAWRESVSRPRLQRLFRAHTRDGESVSELARDEGMSEAKLQSLFDLVAYADACMARVKGHRSMTRMLDTRTRLSKRG
jgi:hypothetical protein